jgi:hypothetical protein
MASRQLDHNFIENLETLFNRFYKRFQRRGDGVDSQLSKLQCLQSYQCNPHIQFGALTCCSRDSGAPNVGSGAWD